MALTNAYGFFYQMGSTDVPNNMSLDSKFGFELSSSIPVFSYTLNDVEKSFNSPQVLSADGKYNSSMRSIFIAEALGNADIKTENVTTSAWISAFKIIEYLYNNQATFVQGASLAAYINAGDEALSKNSDTNAYYVSSYVPKSLTYELSSLAGRVRYVSFQAIFSSTVVSFTIYFDANAFVERSDGIRYKVYRYNDSPPEDATITQTEFKNNITTILFDILKEGRYNTWVDFYTKKRTGESTYVTEQFFIFTSVSSTMLDSTKKIQVKKYLLDYYNNDTTKLRYTYPDLFDENRVSIIPMYENKVTYASGSEVDVHSLSIENLRTTLSTFGFDIIESSTKYRPTELFHVGAGTGFTPANGSRPRYIYPVLAVEVDVESVIKRPITTRMQDYTPIYGSIDTGNAATFHAILLAILDYLTGVSTAIDSTLISLYEVTIYPTSVDYDNRKHVDFKFIGVIWTVYGTKSA